MCRAADATGTAFSPCVGDEDCAIGTTCLGIYGVFTCWPLCAGDPDCASVGSSCSPLSLGSPPVEVPGVATCGCNLASKTDCAGLLCTWISDTPFNVTGCRPSGSGGVGDACAAYSDCQPGHFCSGTCFQYCEVASPVCDVPGQTCHAWNPGLLIGQTEFGGCW